MKHIKIIIPIVIIFILIISVGTVLKFFDKSSTNQNEEVNISNTDFNGCKVEVLQHGIYGGGILGQLNSEDTKYFINIINAMELGVVVENYQLADGESTKQYLITLSNGDEIYFGQGYGEAEGYENECFVHINDRVYTVKNPAVLNALYVIQERFAFYDRLSCVAGETIKF